MKNTVIIVNTCDAYEDVWDLFFCAFNEYWPTCDYNIIINTESKQKNISKNVTVSNFNSPNNKDMWGLRLKATLNKCNSSYVLMLYDDFILEKIVNQDKINNCIRWLDENKEVTVFYFLNNSSGENIDDYRFNGFELLPSKVDYKLNSAPAIWRRNKLLEYIEDNDNPWAWEFFGSYRTYYQSDLFYCVKKECEDIYPYNYAMGGAIYRGKWVGEIVIPLINKYNLKINVNTRGLADGMNSNNKRSLLWKVKFLFLGFRMIGFGVFFYIYRITKKKLII